MLQQSTVEANIPAADLDRARRFYSEKLGLTPVATYGEAALRYRTDGGAFNVYQTQYAGQAGHTIAQWHVADLDAEVRALREKGVVFEVYDMPGVEWHDDIATMPGMGRSAWFKDSEGNILCLDEEKPDS